MQREQNNASGATVCGWRCRRLGGKAVYGGRIARNRSSTICTLYRAIVSEVEGGRSVGVGGGGDVMSWAGEATRCRERDNTGSVPASHGPCLAQWACFVAMGPCSVQRGTTASTSTHPQSTLAHTNLASQLLWTCRFPSAISSPAHSRHIRLLVLSWPHSPFVPQDICCPSPMSIDIDQLCCSMLLVNG
jgi:hypothetical protein